MIEPLLQAFIMMGGLGIIIGIGLAVASKVFYVYVDPKVLAVDDALPGANCGGCGLPGCTANAEAIVAGKAEPNSCVAGSAELADIIAGLLGVTVEAKEPDIALPGCTYGLEDSDIKYLYSGVSDCRAAALLGGGMKVCNIGCLGLGTCASACPFDAITMGEDNLPVVDEVKCTGCGTCERVCPKHIINLSSVTRRIIKEYTTEDCTTPCQRKCPAGIDIKEYIHQVALGDFHQALQVIKERNPFPTVIGRICPAPCETECRRMFVDEPVAINALKRFCADFERENGKRILPFKAPETNRSVAVIGGGIEGLSTAFFLARLGHGPTVFEATDVLGGLLRTAIARNRLPMEILDWDIEGVREMGVKTETGKSFGKEVTLTSLLKEDFEAVFIASGGWDSRLVRGTGSEVESPIPGTYLLIDLLRAGDDTRGQISMGSDVVIAGGGHHVISAISTCREMGAKNIHVLFQEAGEEDNADTAEIEKAGATVIFEAGITRLTGEENRLTQIEYTDLKDGASVNIPAQTLVIASGRFPEIVFVKPGEEETGEEGDAGQKAAPEGPLGWEGILPYKQSDFSDQVGLLAKGDPLTDISAAIRAIASGRRGAASIHQVMYGLDISLPDQALTPDTDIQNVDQVCNVNASTRQIMPLCKETDESESNELELGFTEEMARSEADRCLQCGLICYQHGKDDVFPLAAPGPVAIIEGDAKPETTASPVKASLSDFQRIQ